MMIRTFSEGIQMFWKNSLQIPLIDYVAPIQLIKTKKESSKSRDIGVYVTKQETPLIKI